MKPNAPQLLAMHKEQDPGGNTALMWDVANAKTRDAVSLIRQIREICAELEIHPGEILDVQDRFTRNTALHLAIAKGSYHINTDNPAELPLGDAAAALLDAGANPDIPDKHGNTPLHIAFIRRDLAAIELLLKNGAKLDIRNALNEMPKDMLDISFAEAHELIHGQCIVYAHFSEEEWNRNRRVIEENFQHRLATVTTPANPIQSIRE